MKRFLSCFIVVISMFAVGIAVAFACPFSRPSMNVMAAVWETHYKSITTRIFVGSKATFTMDDGVFTDWQYESKDMYRNEYTGVFYVAGTLVMNGGEIKDCENINEGAVYVDSDGTMKLAGGTISNCSTAMSGWQTGYAQGAAVNSQGTFTMESGLITGNVSAHDGGGVYIHGGTFTMTGGEISGNTAERGSAIYVNSGTFKYAGGTIDGEIALSSSATFAIGKEPETPLDIYYTSEPTNGRIAKLDGIDSIDLSKINLISHPDAQLAIQTISGTKWIVMAKTYNVSIQTDNNFDVVIGKYDSYDSIPKSEIINNIEMQVPEGTIITYKTYDKTFQIGDTYISVVDPPGGYSFMFWNFFDLKNDHLSFKGNTFIIGEDIRIIPSGEQGSSGVVVAFLSKDYPEHKEKSNEYYLENKRQFVKHDSQKKSRVS